MPRKLKDSQVHLRYRGTMLREGVKVSFWLGAGEKLFKPVETTAFLKFEDCAKDVVERELYVCFSKPAIVSRRLLKAIIVFQALEHDGLSITVSLHNAYFGVKLAQKPSFFEHLKGN